METQLPEGLVGEKLAELEKGNYTTPIKEDVPLTPPKFITQVRILENATFLDQHIKHSYSWYRSRV
jgi:hypothetical protein